MSRKRRHSYSKGNMQKPYKRVDISEKRGFKPYPWQETLMNKLDQFNSTLTVNGDRLDSSQRQLNFDANSNTITFNVLKNSLDSLSTKYSGSAKMFLDEKSFMMFDSESKDIQSGYILDTQMPFKYSYNRYTVPLEFRGNVEFNQDALNGIASALGLSSNSLNNFNQAPTSKFGTYKNVISSNSVTEDPPTSYGKIPSIYIEKDMDWYALTHHSNILPPEWDNYTEIEVTEEYKDLRRIWDPNGPIWLDKHHDFEEISTSMYLHPELIKVISQIRDQDKINDILHKMRYLLYKSSTHIFQRDSLHFNPTNELFQEYNILARNKAVALDNSKDNQVYIETIDLKIGQLFEKHSLKHLDVDEQMLGIALAARNIMVTKRDTGLRDNLWPKVALFDVDFTAYNPYLNVTELYLDDISKYPEEFFKIQINYLISYITKIISGIKGFRMLKLFFINYKEWIVDVIRYISEIYKHQQMTRLDTSPILYPIPMRFLLDYNRDYESTEANPHLVENLIPAEIINWKLIHHPTMRAFYINALWNNLADLNVVREMPFRDELAPQLWDVTYYSSVLEPVWAVKFQPNQLNIDISYRYQICNLYTSIFAETINSGYRQSDGGLGIARKEYEDDMARLGWYVGFLEDDNTINKE